jgi:hypothetical protein
VTITSCHQIRHYTNDKTNIETNGKSSNKIIDGAKWLLAEGKRYWQGTKEIWRNYKEAKRIQQIGYNKVLTREQTLFVNKAVWDFKLLIPYALLLSLPLSTYVFPLIVIFIVKKYPNLFPDPYWTKEQKLVESERFSVERRQLSEDIIEIIEERIAALEQDKKQLLNSSAMLDLIDRATKNEFISFEDLKPVLPFFEECLNFSTMDIDDVKIFAQYFGLQTSLLTDKRVRKNLGQYLNSLRQDDKLLQEEGGPSKLTEPQLRETLNARGWIVSHKVSLSPSAIDLAKHWLNASLDRSVPNSALVTYAALNIAQAHKIEELPKELTH